MILSVSKVVVDYLDRVLYITQAENLPTRLQRIYAGIIKMTTKCRPNSLAVKQIFMGKNSDSALKLSQARGIGDFNCINNQLMFLNMVG
ncbi:MAG: crossover junction endodeoxyribonuclease RuvC [Arsenophonus sp. NC-PG7-MAG3]